MFYTLPYQASMNAMHRRLTETFGDNVGLAHGRALLALYRMIADEEPDKKVVVLLHGRLNGRDRLKREEVVRQAAGSNSQSRRKIALVATQVVEVSLDIDLDTIFTDPAPLEALVQRFGRVNRRRLQPDLAPVHVFDQPDNGQHVYDKALVRATLAILARENDKPVQEDRIGAWLDEIYTGEIRRNWLAEYDHAATEFAETLICELHPFDSDDDKETLFYDAFDGVDVLPLRFLDEYRALAESEPLRAQELLVSIRSGQYKQIVESRRQCSASGEYPIVVDVPYDDGDTGIGLDLSMSRSG
ncbi:MAG: hypothetical protein ACUVR3_11480 [Candidatus Roseilinea sp.]|uniref:hypothetical protein n=1 Tax=Candidatus Roseilinea sp. TaxID=2838777 RepID=UPI00404A63A2